MANPKSRVLPQIMNVYLFIFFAHCFDVFSENLMGDSKVFGTNFYGDVFGLFCIIVACMVKKVSAPKLGLIMKPKRIVKGLGLGAVFSLVPLGVVAVFMMLLYTVTNWEWAALHFIPPNINYSPYGLLGSTLAYGFTISISVLMRELFFREYIFSQARPVYSFFDTNLIQAVLYVPLPLTNHFKNIFYGKYGSIPHFWLLMLSIAVFYVVHEFLTAIKWGMLKRVTNDIWPIFFDHYIYNFIGFSLFLSQSKISEFYILFKLMAVQILSFLMVLIYYKRKRIEKEKLQLERKQKRITGQQQQEEMQFESHRNAVHAEENAEILEDFDPHMIHRQVEAFASPSASKHHHHHHSQSGRHHDSSGEHHRSRHAQQENTQELESVKDGDVEHLVQNFKQEFTDSINSHTHNGHHHTDASQKDDSLMDLDQIKIDDFYKEYAKEMERQQTEDNSDADTPSAQ